MCTVELERPGTASADEVIVVCTLIEALPTATSLGLLASKYGGDEAEASQLVTISTVLSIITMPIMVGVLLGGLI